MEICVNNSSVLELNYFVACDYNMSIILYVQHLLPYTADFLKF